MAGACWVRGRPHRDWSRGYPERNRRQERNRRLPLWQLKATVRATVRVALEEHLRHRPTKVSRSRLKRLRG
jgi:hypothetical protein